MSEASPLSQQVAAEVRAQLARAQVRTSSLAEPLGISVTGVNRRLNGSVPFSVDELAAVAGVLGVEVVALIPQGAAVPMPRAAAP